MWALHCCPNTCIMCSCLDVTFAPEGHRAVMQVKQAEPFAPCESISPLTCWQQLNQLHQHQHVRHNSPCQSQTRSTPSVAAMAYSWAAVSRVLPSLLCTLRCTCYGKQALNVMHRHSRRSLAKFMSQAFAIRMGGQVCDLKRTCACDLASITTAPVGNCQLSIPSSLLSSVPRSPAVRQQFTP